MLPPKWRKVFVIRGTNGKALRYTKLPLGWANSPGVCQHIVPALTQRALRGQRAQGWVCIDDILIVARSEQRL